MSKIRKTETKWLAGLKVPSKKKYKTKDTWLERFYEINKKKLDPVLVGSADKKKQFIESIREQKKNRHLMWQLDTKKITNKQAIESFARNFLLSEREIERLNVRQMLKTSGMENKLKGMLGVKNITAKNISWNKDEKTFEYNVYKTELIDGKKVKTLTQSVKIGVNTYNKDGYHSITLT